jgi:hypothetical protein
LALSVLLRPHELPAGPPTTRAKRAGIENRKTEPSYSTCTIVPSPV